MSASVPSLSLTEMSRCFDRTSCSLLDLIRRNFLIPTKHQIINHKLWDMADQTVRECKRRAFVLIVSHLKEWRRQNPQSAFMRNLEWDLFTFWEQLVAIANKLSKNNPYAESIHPAMVVFLLLDCSEDSKTWCLIETRRKLESLKYYHLQECENGDFKEEEDEDIFGITSRFLDESNEEWKRMVYITEHRCPLLLKRWGCDR